MRKRMEKLAAKLNNQMILTEMPANLDLYDGTSYKYFLCWTVTHNIFKAFQTQREVVEFLESAIPVGQKIKDFIMILADEKRKINEK